MAAHNRELSRNPLVSLEADKLLGMRQVAKVTGGANGASRDRDGSAGGAADSRAGASRFLSRIGEVPPLAEASKLLSKIGVGEDPGPAVSREEMSRLLSKIGDAETDGPAVSHEEMSRMLSKISETPI